MEQSQTLGILLIVVLLAISLFSAQIIGKWGEIKVIIILSLLNKDYKKINNLILKHGNKKSQIDHVIVSKYGLFVIETKNYKGRIYGSERAEYWKQYLFRKSYLLYSPILQNKVHVYAIRRALADFPLIKIIPITVFVGNAKLHLRTISVVAKLFNLNSHIKIHKQIVLSEDEVDIIYNLLKKNNNIKIENSDKPLKKYTKDSCPLCSSKLHIKYGKFGPFKGCTNFPTCRYTMNI